MQINIYQEFDTKQMLYTHYKRYAEFTRLNVIQNEKKNCLYVCVGVKECIAKFSCSKGKYFLKISLYNP